MPGEAVYGFAFIAVAAWIGLFYVVIYRTNGALPAARPLVCTANRPDLRRNQPRTLHSPHSNSAP